MIARGRAAAGLFVLTVYLGSFLLFLVEPMVARMALPALGGASAVWNSAMLVYQALLLAGYGYAHALGRLRPRAQGWIHAGVLVLAAAWLPIGVTASDASASPAIGAPWLFVRSVGPLFLAVAAQAPLIQRWFALTQPGREPYALYAASNLGSFAGLLAYPFLAEPLLALPAQSRWWSAGYVALALLTLGCALRLPRAGAATARPTSPAPRRGAVARWIALSFVPSALMLSTSTYLATDIVAMPLLWVLPLGLYLLSFAVAFARARRLAGALTLVAPAAILLFGGTMMGGSSPHPLLGAGVALTLLFLATTALHTRLYDERPAPDRLTGFYLAVALGGALGGVFAGLLAPVLFDWTYEYPLMILAAGLLAPQSFLFAWQERLWRRPRAARIATAAVLSGLVALVLLRIGQVPGFTDSEQGLPFLVIALAGVVTIGAPRAFTAVLLGAMLIFGGARSLALSWEPGVRTRSYFGVYTVENEGDRRVLIHGTTLHGVELTGSRARETTPTTYYVPGSGVGQAMEALPALYGPAARVGVVGLGSGTLASYARAGQAWRFYEIDPAMERIARTRFRFLADAAPAAPVVIGDARLSLARERAASLDLLALDAFSSDAIPVHLLTAEAFATYARVLALRGLLLVHISNRYIDLQPVIAAAAAGGGWRAIQLTYQPPEGAVAESASQWVAMSRDPGVIAALELRDAEWQPLPATRGFRAWRDDHATILPLLRLGA